MSGRRFSRSGETKKYLTTAEAKRILLNNIFGVGIDSQAARGYEAEFAVVGA